MSLHQLTTPFNGISLFRVFLLLIILISNSSFALSNSNPSLVKDINAILDDSSTGYCGNPEFVTVGTKVFYCGEDFTGGEELWISDGTVAGTVRLKDIISGVESSSPRNLTDVNGTLFFTANDGTHGRELWKSDGTEAGTQRVKDITTGVNSTSFSSVAGFVNVNGVLYFSILGSSSPHLWKSDGSVAGTVAVTTSTDPNNISNLTDVNGTLFFSGKDGTNSNYKLWKSNGTQASTVMVKDMTPSQLKEFTHVNGILYFTSYDATQGRELWKSDGTAANTVLVQDIYPGTNSSNPTKLTSVNLTTEGSTLFFTAVDGTSGQALWKSNAAGTAILNPTGSLNPNYLTESNGQLIFKGGDRLWKSDGTLAGTIQVDAGATEEAINPYYITDINGIVYFSAKKDNGSYSHELWKSNGTLAGTQLVKDIIPGGGNSGSNPNFLTKINNSIIFTISQLNQSKKIMWASDGTEAGTIEIKDMYPSTQGAYVKQLTVANTKLFFSAYDGSHGTELWMTDGSEAGTTLVADINVGISNSDSNYLTAINNSTLLFKATDGASYGLWKTDGVTTSPVSSAYPSSQAGIGIINSTMYFEKYSSHELWKSDGTGTGTVLVKDIKPGPGAPNIRDMTELNSKAMFVADDGTNTELWTSDGTGAGTFSLNSATTTNSYSSINNLATVNLTGVGERLFFTAWDATHSTELWISDGTEAGTHLVKDINTNSSGICNNAFLTEYNGKVYFCARGNTGGDKLWVSDGTEAGTVVVTSTTYPSSPTNLLVADNILFFSGYDASSASAPRRELYKTDGTNAGTVLVKDINPNQNSSSSPSNLTNVDETLYFIADDGTGTTAGQNKKQIWKSDGTSSGTIKVTFTDLIFQGTIEELTSFNSTLYFIAKDREHHKELWKISDNDLDSINDEVEHLVPDLTGAGLGDGNGDTTKDKNQSHVTSFKNHADSAWITINNTHNGAQSAILTATAPNTIPTGYQLGLGTFQLDMEVTTAGDSATIEVFTNPNLDITDFMLLGTDTVWDLMGATVTHADNKTKLVFTITDGGEYDRDGLANGMIQLAQGGFVTLVTVDLVITKSIAEVIPGTNNIFTVEVVNNGSGAVNGANVSFPLDTSFSNASWTCVALDGAICTASGTGTINDTVSIPVAAGNIPKVTYTFNVDIDSAATAANDVSTTTTIPAHGYQDANPANNTATHNYSWVPHADLSTMVDLGGASFIPGQVINFTITATNQGPSDSVGASIGFDFTKLSNLSWVCTASAGANCTATGSSANDVVNIPVGGLLSYAITATILPELLGTLNVSSSISIATGSVDDNATNNTTSASASLTPQADLGLTITDSVDPVNKVQAYSYSLVVNNAGLSYATSVVVEDILPSGLGFVSASGTGWNCSTNGATITCTAASLALGAASPIVVNVTAPSGNQAIDNPASVSTATVDNVAANNSTTENTVLMNNPPVLSGIPTTSTLEDAAYSFIPTLTDPDTGDTQTYSITGKPNWATFDTTTGELSGTPLNDDVGISGAISISVNDGAASDTLADFTIEVINVNDAPVIFGSPSTNATVGITYSFYPAFSDVDEGDSLTLTITGKPGWASFNTTTGALTGSPATTDIGASNLITISVSDGIETASLTGFVINVTEGSSNQNQFNIVPILQLLLLDD